MLTPYANLRERVDQLEHSFVKRYGTRVGFRLKRYIRTSAKRGGEREHLAWSEWDGTKRALRRLLAEAKGNHPTHEDFQFFVEIARNDVRRDTNFEEDVTSIVDKLDTGR